MENGTSDAAMVGNAQGLLADDRHVWIMRRGSDKRHQIRHIYVEDDTRLVCAALVGDIECDLFLAPGELAAILAED